MIPIYQQAKDDCFAACIASLLHCPLSFVPPMTAVSDVRQYDGKLQKWLHQYIRCGGYVEFGFPEPLPELMSRMMVSAETSYYILTGTNRAAAAHSVVCLGGMIAHDPSAEPGHHTLVGPVNDGFYRVGFLLLGP